MTAVAIAATPSRAGTRWLLPALVIAVAWGLAQWAAVPYTVGVFHDDGVYALLARSIATGGGFHYSHLPGTPAATHYPPLYPLLLAAAWRIMPAFPENVPFLLGVNSLLLGIAAYGWVVFAEGRLGWSRRIAVVAALVATLGTPVLTIAGALLSEPMFLALLWPVMLMSERSVDEDDRKRAAWTGALIGVLMLVRTHAIALLGAVLFVLVARRQLRRASTVFLAALVVHLPWSLFARSASPIVAAPLEGAYGSYTKWMADGVRDAGIGFPLATARLNLSECWLLLQDRFAAGMPTGIHHLTMALVVAAMVMGSWSLVKRAPVTMVFAVLYLAIVLVFPFTPWRYVWAIWPLFALMVLEGGRVAWLRAGRWRVAVAICALLPALAFLRTELHAFATRSWRAPARQAGAQIAPALEWVRAHTTPRDVVLVAGEQVIALYTGRQAAPPISITAAEYLALPTAAELSARLVAMLAVEPARYVVLLAPSMVLPADALADMHPGLRRIQSLAGGAVYEVVP